MSDSSYHAVGVSRELGQKERSQSIVSALCSASKESVKQTPHQSQSPDT